MYKIVNVYVAGKLNGAYPSCDHCGHDIRNVFVIQDEAGQQMQVGSDCVRILTAQTEAYTDATRWQNRMDRAAAQWRDAKKKANYPQPLRDETREQYINRRINEMANALKAGKAWKMYSNQKFHAKGHIGLGWSMTWDLRVELRAERMGLKIQRAQVVRRHAQRHAKRWHANPFDFQRPIWELLKI